jgi:uncharacterized protein HemX
MLKPYKIACLTLLLVPLLSAPGSPQNTDPIPTIPTPISAPDPHNPWGPYVGSILVGVTLIAGAWFKGRNSSVEMELKYIQDQRERLQEYVNQQISEKDKQIQALQKDIAELKDELSRIRQEKEQQVTRLVEERDRYREQLGKLQREHDLLMFRYRSLQAETSNKGENP